MDNYLNAFNLVKDDTTSQYERMVNFIEVLCDLENDVYADYSEFSSDFHNFFASDDPLLPDAFSFTDVDGNLIVISLHDQTESLIISLVDQATTSQEVLVDDIINGVLSLNEVELTVLNNVNSSIVTLNDLVYAVADTSKMYDCMDQITEQILADESMAADQVTAILDSIDPAREVPGVQDIRGALAGATEGKLSPQYWLSYLKNNYFALDKSIDDGHFEMDDSYGGTNSMFSSRAIAKYYAATSHALTDIKNGISRVLTGIVGALSNAIRGFNAQFTDWKVTSDSMTNYCDYPVSALAADRMITGLANDGIMKLYSTPWCDYYYFNNQQDEKSCRNAFLKVGCNKFDIAHFFRDSNYITCTENPDFPGIYDFRTVDQKHFFEGIYEQIMESPDPVNVEFETSSNDRIASTVEAALIAYVLSMSEDFIEFTLQSSYAIPEVPVSVFSGAMTEAQFDFFRDRFMTYIYRKYVLENITHDLSAQELTYCLDWCRAIENWFDPSLMGAHYFMRDLFMPTGNWSLRNFIDRNQSYDHYLYGTTVPAVPKSRMIGFPTTTTSAVVAVAIGVVVAGFLVGGLIRKIKVNKVKRCIKRETKAKRKIASHKEAYDRVLNDPNATSIQKSVALRKYSRSTAAYNRKASLFGRRTYDPVNGLYTSAGNGASASQGAMSMANINRVVNLISG